MAFTTYQYYTKASGFNFPTRQPQLSARSTIHLHGDNNNEIEFVSPSCGVSFSQTHSLAISHSQIPMEKFVAEENEPALPVRINDTRSIGQSKQKVFTVARRKELTVWNSCLFIREELVRFEQAVNATFWKIPHKRFLYVDGPPGCGKTCFFYLWARLRSVQDCLSVLLIQYRENAISDIWIREADGVLFRFQGGISSDELLAEAKDILQKRHDAGKLFNLCIHDGVIQGQESCGHMISMLHVAAGKGIIGKVVHVTSLAFSLSTGGQRLDGRGSIVRLSLDSWRLEDYYQAMECEEFTKHMTRHGTTLSNDKTTLVNKADVDDDTEEATLFPTDDDALEEDSGHGSNTALSTLSWLDVIETKYFYAGGSARFMFDFELAQLKNELDTRSTRVVNDQWKDFAQGAVAPGTSTAVNSLMQRFSGKAIPVSKYVLLQAYEKCKTQLVSSVQAVARTTNNPVLLGWAFELEQLDLIRLSLESSKANPEHITNGRGFSFHPHSSIEYNEKTLGEGNIDHQGTVIWCTKWNQGCFDLAFWQENTLVALQFTVSKEHSLKPKYIRQLRDELLKRGVLVKKVLLVAVTKSSNGFRFIVDHTDAGCQGNARKPQFTIEAFCSTPLTKKIGTAEFQTGFSSPLETIAMWPEKKKRKKSSKTNCP